MKTTSKEVNLTTRQLHRKTTAPEDNLKGRRLNKKTTSQENNFTGRLPYMKATSIVIASPSGTELDQNSDTHCLFVC